MSFPAVKDEDHPGGETSCSNSRMKGFNAEILQCDSGIWYRLYLGNIQLDFNTERVLIKHNSTLLEVKSDGVYVDGDLYVSGDLNVGGNLEVGVDVVVNRNVEVEGYVSADRIYVNSPRGVLDIGTVLAGIMP